MPSLFLGAKYDNVETKQYLEAAYLAYSYGLLTWDELVREVRGINGGCAK